MSPEHLRGGTGHVFESDEKVRYEYHTNASAQDRKEAEGRFQYVRTIPKLAGVCLLTQTLYLGYRVRLLSSGPSITPSILVFLAIELGFAGRGSNPAEWLRTDTITVSLSLLYLQELGAMGKARFDLPRRLSGPSVPTVDVFVPCRGEALDVILDTVRAICALDYPKARFRIVVLDDGRSAEVEENVLSLSKLTTDVEIYYTSRHAIGMSHSKAGNLNHGLDYVDNLPGGPSEFVAVLDVDMIPLPHWLRAVLPYVLYDKTVALANPPQRFYNLANGDPLVQNLDIWYGAIETIKGCLDSSWCTGSGYVLRRKALDQIGLFPTDNHNDDIMTSIYLQAVGWKTVYVPVTVQWGLAPDSADKHIKQQQRWFAAHIYSACSFWNPRAKGRSTKKQRVKISMASITVIFASSTIAMCMVTIPVLLLSSSLMIAYQTKLQVRTLYILETISFGTQTWAGFLRYRASGSTSHILADWAQAIVVPFHIITFARISISKLLKTGYKIAPSVVTTPIKQSKSSMPIRRIRNVLANHFSAASFVCITILISYIATAYSALWYSNAQPEPLLHILAHVGYPPLALAWLRYIFQAWTALSCMVPSTSRWPGREKQLERDQASKVAYPSGVATSTRRVRPSQAYTIFAAATAVHSQLRMSRTAPTTTATTTTTTEEEKKNLQHPMVLVMGLGRCGTTSLAAALRTLSYTPYDFIDRFQLRNHANLWAGQLRAKYYGEGPQWTPEELREVLRGYDVSASGRLRTIMRT
ncbi:MAG: hypothetical protein Q9220_007234 [cf. Caloplaca sp. 1 TL-2023]